MGRDLSGSSHGSQARQQSVASQRDPMHLLGNMVGLYFFGGEVGRAFGGRALLGLYIAGGLAGGAAHCLWRYWQIRGAYAICPLL